jgi:hypothetical protein
LDPLADHTAAGMWFDACDDSVRSILAFESAVQFHHAHAQNGEEDTRYQKPKAEAEADMHTLAALHMNLAVALMRAHRFADAHDALCEALRLEPWSELARLNMVELVNLRRRVLAAAQGQGQGRGAAGSGSSQSSETNGSTESGSADNHSSRGSSVQLSLAPISEGNITPVQAQGGGTRNSSSSQHKKPYKTDTRSIEHSRSERVVVNHPTGTAATAALSQSHFSSLNAVDQFAEPTTRRRSSSAPLQKSSNSSSSIGSKSKNRSNKEAHSKRGGGSSSRSRSPVSDASSHIHIRGNPRSAATGGGRSSTGASTMAAPNRDSQTLTTPIAHWISLRDGGMMRVPEWMQHDSARRLQSAFRKIVEEEGHAHIPLRSLQSRPLSSPPALHQQSSSESCLPKRSPPPLDPDPVRNRQSLSHSHIKALRQAKSPPRPVLKRQSKSKSVQSKPQSKSQSKPQSKLPSRSQEDVFSRLTNPKSYTGTQAKLNPKRRAHYTRDAAAVRGSTSTVAAAGSLQKVKGNSKACLAHVAVAGGLSRCSRPRSPPNHLHQGGQSPATVDP